MTMTVILSIIFIHWIADFVLQTDKMAKGKSENWGNLLNHTFTYTVVWILPIVFSLKIFGLKMLWFLPITFIAHTLTDFYTSRVNKELWAKGDVHNFFVSVGFDQVLHYVQLFLTYYYLTQ